MGDRNNPIKFGPEWLRNMSRERSAARSNNNQNANSNPGTPASPGPSGSTGGATASNTVTPTATNSNNNSHTSKILLAKLRYGREEMLALYDRNSEAPAELKHIDTLYQSRGKQPVALNNTFEDDARDNLRSAPPIGGMTSGERFGIGRGVGRGVIIDGRGRSRGSYVRQLSAGRGATWHAGSPRMPGYSGGADDDSGPIRPWTNNNNSNRNSGDQTDWATKMFRNKRQGNNTNWRQPQSRDDGEEWRSSEPGRPRQLERWDREWGERPSGDKPQSWSTNRRTWVGGDNQNNEENLPEWAVENAECGGTFDSSGAFHGYSNDDTNLPKHQDSTYPLTRSHTHGSLTRHKVVEEGSEEWWASEKAKKLSPKRFDASELKFKKQPGIGIADVASTSANHKSNSKEDSPQQIQENLEAQPAGPDTPEANAIGQGEDTFGTTSAYKSNKFTESKTFDALMRSDIDLEEASDERGNFQSVIINSNNSLRQKHQHLVPAMNEASSKQMQHMKASMKSNNKCEMDHVSLKSPEDILVDNIFNMSLDEKDMLSSSSNSLITLSSSGMSSGLVSGANQMPQNQNMQMSMSNSALPNQGMNMELHINKPIIQTAVIQPLHQSPGMQPGVMNSPGMPGGMQPGMPCIPGMQTGLQIPGIPAAMQAPNMPNPGYPMPAGGMPNLPAGMQVPRVQNPGMQPVMQNVGISNSALNASLGLPIGPNMGHPMQGMPQQVMPNNSPMGAAGINVMGTASMQGSANMPGFPSGNAMPGMSNNVGNASLFLGQNSSNPSMSSPNEMPMSNHGGQNNMFHMHGMQHSGSQAPFGNSIYSNNTANLAEQWYYEDPERNIQGPFTSKDMYNWYRAGFFSPSLMVRRACESMMRPLGTYGPMVPFAQMDMMPPYPMSGGFERPQGPHENLLNSQATLALDVESLWGQPSTSADLMWMQQPLNRAEARVNNLPIYFWDQQPSAINSNSLLPEEMTKEMKTEDQILAQLRASQNMTQPAQPYMSDLQAPSAQASKAEDCYATTVNATPNMEELHKLIQKDMLTGNVNVGEMDITDEQVKTEKVVMVDQSPSESSVTKLSSQTKNMADLKQPKQLKECDKSAKVKDINNTKSKTKKTKEDKKEEVGEIKTKEEEVIKSEKRSQEPSPSKNKKEDKSNKKDLEKEKKEWIKEGFTIVKGSEKNSSKDNKKKAEEARVAEEADRKRKEEEKTAADEDKKKKQAETVKKQQEQQVQQQRQASETVAKKAPWSAVSNQAMQATNREGLTLSEIQRLEREKKLEQMKEQQQMMQIIAQQQAAALAREQEMQAGLGWAKKKGSNSSQGQSLAEIQAEARKQAVAAAVAAAAKAIEETETVPPPQTNHAPWASTHNGGSTAVYIKGGFWDTQLKDPSKQDKKEETQKPAESKNKKKPTLIITSKKETPPAVEFEAWCTSVLTSWSSKIDVPTFVGFLKDIESPYEVKDYVKCYLGETKDSSDFARQFLERRSKLLRVGMVTPSDDLCSPAIAVNPRTTSGSDYQEVKGKGKKTKKNKMLKVDARILGFSVTAAEDRINVGDIDTA